MKPQRIYVIEEEHGLTRIGATSNFDDRRAVIDGYCPFVLSRDYCSPLCYNARDILKRVRNRFAASHKKGLWYTLDFDKACEYINEVFKENNPEPTNENQTVVVDSEEFKRIVEERAKKILEMQSDNIKMVPFVTANI